MKIMLNGTEKEISTSTTLFTLIQASVPNQQRVIAEVNGEIVQNPCWNDVHIQDGDCVELVSFVGGG